MLFDVSTLVLAFGAFMGIIISPFLLFAWKGNVNANRILGFSILTLSIILMNTVLQQIAVDRTKWAFLIRLSSPLFYLIGPLAFLYVKACTEEFTFKTKYWLNFVPSLIDFTYNLDFYFNKTAEEKLTYQHDMMDGDPQLEIMVISIIKILHIFIYYLASQREIIRYRRNLKNVKTYIDPAFETWLRVYTNSILGIIVIAVLLVLTRFHNSLEVAIFLTFFLIILGVQLAALIKPEIFHGFPEPRKAEALRTSSSSLMSEEEKDKLFQQLLTYMEEERPFEDPEISLDNLAEQLQTKRNYLSLVINEKGGKNFMDFINSYRVEEIKQRFEDPESSNFTILSIAFDVGFNSKSAFYTAFKKSTGVTPTEYRKSIAVV